MDPKKPPEPTKAALTRAVFKFSTYGPVAVEILTVDFLDLLDQGLHRRLHPFLLFLEKKYPVLKRIGFALPVVDETGLQNLPKDTHDIPRFGCGHCS
jgi:hypothetical protein